MNIYKVERILKAAVRVLIGAAIVVVFIRNITPEFEEAVIIDAVVSETDTVSSKSEITSAPQTTPFSVTAATSGQAEPESAAETNDTLPNITDNENNIQSTSTAEMTTSSLSSATVSIGTEPTPVQTEAPASTSSDTRPALININTADSAALQTLYGIGEVKAQAIIDYRNANGGFKSVDELINVKGIGEKTLENIRDYVTV